MNDKFFVLEAELKKLSKHAMLLAEKAHNAIFVEDRNDSAITGYVNAAYSLACAAQSVYSSNIEELEHNDIDEFFHQFGVFVEEVLDNIAANHSHQWSDIEFEKLKEKYDYSVLS